MNQNSTQKPPVSVGEEYEVTISGVGDKGDGIARVKNFIVFVANTKKGDQVKIRITKVLSKVGFAEVAGKAEHAKPTSAMDLEDAPPAPSKYEDSEDFGSDLEDEE